MKQNISILASRLSLIQKNIEKACVASNKSPEDLKLVAVSKSQPFEAIKHAYSLGIRDFGESYVQELKSKMNDARAQNMLDIRWHFLGAIQSNKIKDIVQANFVHSVGSIRHAELLNKASHHNLGIFLQVKLKPSVERLGFSPEELLEALKACTKLDSVKVLGLMTILPIDDPATPAQQWFGLMCELHKKLEKELKIPLKLSMGMSGDYEEAILFGADIIRIGSGLFGSRN